MDIVKEIDEYIDSGYLEGLAQVISDYCKGNSDDAVEVLEKTFFKLLLDSDRILALQRFNFKSEEFKVVFVPQCANCNNNVDGEKCSALKIIPSEYRSNQKDCPEYILDDDSLDKG